MKRMDFQVGQLPFPDIFLEFFAQHGIVRNVQKLFTWHGFGQTQYGRRFSRSGTGIDYDIDSAFQLRVDLLLFFTGGKHALRIYG
jgi:hypothetical protein